MEWPALFIGILSEAWPFVLLFAIPLLVLRGVQKLLGSRASDSRITRFIGLLLQHSTVVVGVAGNALVLLICVQFASYIKPGGYGRPMLEGLLFVCIALGTALVGLPSAALQMARRGQRVTAAIGLALCLTPLPLGSVLLNAIADHYNWFIEP